MRARSVEIGLLAAMLVVGAAPRGHAAAWQGQALATAPTAQATEAPEPSDDEQDAREDERRQRDAERQQRQEERRQRETERAERADESYEEGTEQLDEGDWDGAIRAFQEVIKAGGRRCDGALYWKAYAQSRRGQRAEALASIAELQKSYPQSRFVGEAKALDLEIRQASGQAPKPENESNEEIKLLALNGLMNSDPSRAVPLLESFLTGSNSLRLKDRALFVLSQSDTPQAREILARVAKTGSNPDLQLKAIKYLGVDGDARSLDLLASLYAGTTDVPMKRAILRSFMAAEDTKRLFELAKTEKNPELRREAIRQIGASEGTHELVELYRVETVPELKEEILRSMGVAEAGTSLLDILRSESDPRLRSAAIEALGIIDSPDLGAQLASLYKTEKDPATKEKILESLFTQENAKALIDIARTEKEPHARRKVIELLSNLDSKEATDYMLEILQK